MKKFLLTLGTATTIFAPLATVVACEEAETPSEPDAGTDGGSDSDTDAGDEADTGGGDEASTEDKTNLNLLDFSMPVYDYPTDANETNAQLEGVIDWANTLGLEVGTGKGVLTITYRGELTKFIGGVSVTTSIEGVYNISDYATSVGGTFTDLEGALTYAEANLTIAPTPELQLTAAGSLMYYIFVDEKY